MPGPSKALPALEQRLVERLLDFERLDEAWPNGCTPIERAEIGRHREDALSEIATERRPWPMRRCSSAGWRFLLDTSHVTVPKERNSKISTFRRKTLGTSCG